MTSGFFKPDDEPWLEAQRSAIERRKSRGPRLPIRAVAKNLEGMNKTEIAYSFILEARLMAGEIVDFWFEGITLKLGPDCRYTPDFLVQMADATMEIHEVKGGSRKADGSIWFHGMDDSMVKLRVAVDKFPFKGVRAILLKKGEWVYKEFLP